MPLTPNTARDSSPEAELVLIQLLRDRPAAMRLNDAVTASNRVAQQCKNAIRRSHPQSSEDEINLRFIEINYGKAIANAVRSYLSKK